MAPLIPTKTDAERDAAILNNRIIVQKIKNGYLCKFGSEWVFCGDLDSVRAFLRVMFEPTEKAAPRAVMP